MIQLKSEARDIVLRLKNKKYGYLSIGQFKHSIIFYDLAEYYYNYNGQWKTLERKIPTNSSWMTSWLYTRRERTYRLGYRAQIPVARRPNDGVLFPTYPPLLAKNTGTRREIARVPHESSFISCYASWRYVSVFVHLQLNLLSPPPSRVRVQHRVRADFERRRPGGRRTFISRIGLHDRHLITNGRDTPYLPRFYTAHPVPPYSFSWGGEGNVVSARGRRCTAIIIVACCLRNSPGSPSWWNSSRDGIHFSNRDAVRGTVCLSNRFLENRKWSSSKEFNVRQVYEKGIR